MSVALPLLMINLTVNFSFFDAFPYLLTPVRFQRFQFYLQNTRKSRHFWRQVERIEDVLLIYFQEIDSFCAIIYNYLEIYSSCFVKNSSLFELIDF